MRRFSEVRAGLFRCQESSSKNTFDHCGGPVKLVKGCLSARKDRESRFHFFRGLVKFVKACLSASNDRESRFQHSEGLVKLV